jgi:hypothetical protein
VMNLFALNRIRLTPAGGMRHRLFGVWAAVIIQLHLLFVVPLHDHQQLWSTLRQVCSQLTFECGLVSQTTNQNDPLCPACTLANRGSIAAAIPIRVHKPSALNLFVLCQRHISLPKLPLHKHLCRGPPTMSV